MPVVCSAPCLNTSAALRLWADALRCHDDQVIVDARGLRWVEPFALASLGAVLHALNERGQQLHLTNLSYDLHAYLDRMDVLRQQGIVCEPLPLQTRRHNRSDSLVEVKCIGDRRHVDAAANRLAEAMVGHIPGLEGEPDEMTGFTPADYILEPLSYIFTELFQNSLTHGQRAGFQSAAVWVCAQYYPSRDLIRIGVVDNGCGVLATLAEHRLLKERSHRAAIYLALQPRVSCNRDVQLRPDATNSGVGLTTVHRITRQAGGVLQIATGTDLATIGTAKDSVKATPHWQGVGIAITIHRQKLKDVNFRRLLPAREIGRTAPPMRFEP